MTGAGIFEQLLDEIRALRTEVAELRQPRATPELVTVKEFAARRSLGCSTVRAAIADGRLQATKIGRSVRIAADAAIGTAAKRTKTTAQRAARILGLVGGGK